jgi:hypothetical protein
MESANAAHMCTWDMVVNTPVTRILRSLGNLTRQVVEMEVWPRRVLLGADGSRTRFADCKVSGAARKFRGYQVSFTGSPAPVHGYD